MKGKYLFCVCVLLLMPFANTRASQFSYDPTKHYMIFGAFSGNTKNELSGGEVGYLGSYYNLAMRITAGIHDTGSRAPIYHGYNIAILVQPDRDFAPYIGGGLFFGGRHRGDYDCRWAENDDFCDNEYKTEGFAEAGLMFKGDNIFLGGFARTYVDTERDFSESTVVGFHIGYQLHYGYF
jgi:hypothetical protein